MAYKITRRDLLNAMAVGFGASVPGVVPTRERRAQGLEHWPEAAREDYAPERAVDYYPPARTGIRGDHDGSFDVAHELRKGVRWRDLSHALDTGEDFDLVVVGGGISGLAAAHFYRRRVGKRARILVLENHDDF